MKMDVFFILEKRFLLQISFVSGVKAQHTARKSDCFASSSKDTKPRDKVINMLGQYQSVKRNFAPMLLWKHRSLI